MVLVSKKRSSSLSPQLLEQSQRVTLAQVHPCHVAFVDHLITAASCVLSNVAILPKLIKNLRIASRAVLKCSESREFDTPGLQRCRQSVNALRGRRCEFHFNLETAGYQITISGTSKSVF